MTVHWRNALDGLGRSEQQYIEQRMVRRYIGARASIFEPHDRANSLYVIQTGRVRLIYRDAEGLEFTTGVWGHDYVIGLISAFLNEQRFLAAQSLEATEMSELSRHHLHALMRELPIFAMNIAGILARLAHDSILRSGPLVTQPAANRLAGILLRLATPSTIPPGKALAVTGLTQEDLARLVGVSRSWINTTLAAFEDQGLIRRQKRSIDIIDVERLLKLFPDHLPPTHTAGGLLY